MMKFFDYIIGILLLIVAILIWIIPNKILPNIDASVQNLLGVICFVLSGIISRIIKLEEENKLKN